MANSTSRRKKSSLLYGCGGLTALMLVCAAGPADAQTRSRRDVTDPGRVWIGTVAPPGCIGGGAAFRDGAERRAADEIVAVESRRMVRSSQGRSSEVMVCGYSVPTEQQRRQGVQAWLQSHDPCGDVEASFVVSAQGRVGDVRILSAPDPELARIVARSLESSPLWIPARRLRGGVRRPEPAEYTVVVRGSRLRGLLAEKIGEATDGTGK